MVMRLGRTGWLNVGDAVFYVLSTLGGLREGWLAAGKIRGDRKASEPCRTAFGSGWREREFTAKAKQSTLVPFSDENRRHGHDLGSKKREGGQAQDKGQNKRARESRETGETRNGQTGQRNRRRGCEGGILNGWRRDEREDLRRNVDGKEQQPHNNQLNPGESNQHQYQGARGKHHLASGGDKMRQGRYGTPYTPWLIPVRDYE
ncbi:hypothetical protein BDP55DRAFT_635499 [Colletotrichum godetiae]|uniref:Uncharacterized protein n=1 Tax=Colletotrichum godetiae TaxID=1209918 RepID=A0AAJ0AEK1_9PEZI|nr:uncharacterized protein BDP55DRAFT_635499 [Colletotrichum godetiae]KAK1671870.1 hypothetical protein BDP55DRAFT_635499 [Colletotrichum godetiae]